LKRFLKIPGFFNKAYIKINLIFGVFLMLFFVYSLSFSARAHNHPIPSFYTKITGKESISSGLSRSFSEIIRGNFKRAKEYNIYGLRVFLFFAVQFFLRFLFSYLYAYECVARNFIVISDSVISIILFIVCFWPFAVSLILTTCN
jgi:hypothetical protein